MRHLKRGRRLNCSGSHRQAMLRNMVTSLFEHGRIVTTPAKAKEARPVAEKLITLAKRGTLADRRRAIAKLHSKGVVDHLFKEIAPRYQNRPGGYCRILHIERRRIGDGGALCLFELVEEEIKKAGKKRVRAKVKKEGGETRKPEAEEKAPAAGEASDGTPAVESE